MMYNTLKPSVLPNYSKTLPDSKKGGGGEVPHIPSVIPLETVKDFHWRVSTGSSHEPTVKKRQNNASLTIFVEERASVLI